MQRLHLALLAAWLSAAFLLLSERRGSERPVEASEQPSLLDVALPEAALVATLDLDALAASRFGRLALSRAVDLATRGGSADGCENRLLARVRRVALTVPASSSSAAALELGVIAESRATSAEVLPCARAALERRGAEPVAARLGRFELLRDRRGQGELAVRDDGQWILSGGRTFRELVDRSAGRLPPDGLESRLHHALRARIGPAPLVISAVLPPGWLERWLEDPDVAASPLADVRALVLRGDLTSDLRLRALLRTADESSASRLEQFVRGLQSDFAPLLAAWLGAEAPRDVRVERRAEELTIELALLLPGSAP